MRPRFLDLFCGIGGLSLGLAAGGLDPVGGVDVWGDALATFAHNHPGVGTYQADIAQVDVGQIETAFGTPADAIDVVAGGPPCQGFSTVGKRDSADPRNALWRALHRVVAEVRPAYVVIENVEGLNAAQGGAIRDAIVAGFNAAGYRMKAALLRAADYGVPQLRKRVVFLGWLDGLAEPHFPRPDGSPPVTVGDAISDLPPLNSGQAKTAYALAPQTPYQLARRGTALVLHNHEAASHPPELVRILEHIPDGGNRKSIPALLQPKSGFHNSYARLASWKPAVAVTSNMRKPSSARATHPSQPRGLTVREGLRLQSFDDAFVVLGTRTSQYLQVGNAVPPLLALAIGREVARAFRANPPAALTRARRMRTPVKRAASLFDGVADLSPSPLG